jgi:hypothetical protein
VSSEKVPHLTILYLGDPDQVSNLQGIIQFVEHAASTSLTQFHMPVDRRGTLGKDEADVLFFRKPWYAKDLVLFRSHLLKDPNIKTAYDATAQFDHPPEVGAAGQPWLPHLTLGYPRKPALPPPDNHGFYEVSFDRIAVWTGDYEGPEFRLRDYFDDEVEPLAHFGVKGMKWGVRKAVAVPKAIGRGTAMVAKDIYFETDFAKSVAHYKIATRASKSWKEKDLPRLNAEYKGTKADGKGSRLKNPLARDTIAYRSRARAAYRDRLNEEAAKMTNGTNTRQYRIDDDGRSNANYSWKVKSVTRKKSSGLEHAEQDNDAEVVAFRVKPTFDQDGFIIGFKQLPMDETEETLAQDGINTAEVGADFLEHFGVKGMKWGVRKAKEGAQATGRGIAVVSKAVRDANFEDLDRVVDADTGETRRSIVEGKIVDKAADAFNRTDLPAIKAKKEYQDARKLRHRLLNPRDPATKKYRKEVQETFVKRLEESANSMTNASGTRQYTIRERGWELPPEGGALPTKRYGHWEVSARDIRHGNIEHATEDPVMLVRVDLDDDGFVSKIKRVDSVLEQSAFGGTTSDEMADIGAEFLEHYGIKGMKWGVRRAQKKAEQEARETAAPTAKVVIPTTGPHKGKPLIGVSGGAKQPPADDAMKVAAARVKFHKSGAQALSNKELQDLATRLNLEQQVLRLAPPPKTRMQKAQEFLMSPQGKQLQEFGMKELTKRATKAAAKSAIA